MYEEKVLVSGCFDLLHSGHVEFFREASQHGRLYVRLGTDENILDLKHHRPMYSNAERVFMVQSIKYVYNADLSAGRGEFDFVEDMKLLKPDIYFVNDDCSNLEKRRLICRDLGIEMIIKPRIPRTGLEERSSTAMKKRLREHQEIEDDERVAKGVEAFHEVFPWRLCFAGGWMDLPFCNKYASGCVVTINIKFNPAICKDMCGLATSSRKHAIRLWNGKFPKHLEAKEAILDLYGVENVDYFGTGTKSYSAGSQDHCGLMYPGVNKLCYNGGFFPNQVIHLNDLTDPAQAAVFSWLERVLYIVPIPFESRPGDYDSQRVNHLTDSSVPEAAKVAMVSALASASELAWRSICSMDSAGLGRALSETMAAWEAMLPYTVDPYRASDGYTGDEEKSAALRKFWKAYDAPHTKGCLFSGAGGGFLMVISDTVVPDGIKIQINHEHFCKPFPSDNLDTPPHDF